MDGVLGFLIGMFVGAIFVVSYTPTKNEMKIRLYELGYSTEKQEQIMSGLYK